MIALAVAVVLVILPAWSRSRSAGAIPPRRNRSRAFTEGQERTYDVHQTIDANISSPLFGDEALSMDVSQVVGWKVVSVDDDGAATIEVWSRT